MGENILENNIGEAMTDEPKYLNPVLENNFKYHEPTPEKIQMYGALRLAGKELAYMTLPKPLPKRK